MALANSEAEICTLAMDLLKASQVNDITSPVSVIEKLCARWYQECRQSILSLYDFGFSFSIRTISRDLLAEAEAGVEGIYSLPIHYLGMRYIENKDIPLDQVDYDISSYGLIYPKGGNAITIGYVEDTTDASKFPGYFKKLLAADIAMVVAVAVTGKLEFLNAMASIRERFAADAQNIELRSKGNKIFVGSRIAGARRARAGEIGGIASGIGRVR